MSHKMTAFFPLLGVWALFFILGMAFFFFAQARRVRVSVCIDSKKSNSKRGGHRHAGGRAFAAFGNALAFSECTERTAYLFRDVSPPPHACSCVDNQ